MNGHKTRKDNAKTNKSMQNSVKIHISTQNHVRIDKNTQNDAKHKKIQNCIKHVKGYKNYPTPEKQYNHNIMHTK